MPDQVSKPERSPRRKFLREVFSLSLLAVGLGVVGGIVWGLVAPRAQITGVDAERVSTDPMSSAPIGADMTFMIIAVVCSFLLTLVALKIGFKNLLASWFAVLIGSFLGTLVLYLIGIWVGNMNVVDPVELAVGQTTDSALTIRATGVMFVWPLVAMALVAIVSWWRSRRALAALKLIPVPPGPLEAAQLAPAASRPATEEVTPARSQE